MIWLRLDTVPPLWDEAHYLRTSHELYRALIERGPGPFFAAFSTAIGTKAPLIAVLPFPFYVLFGESHLSACYVNVALLAIASALLFRLGEILVGRLGALSSVVILNSFPLVAAMSRTYLVEYGLMTMVIAWMYYLVRWQRGEVFRSSVALGLLLGLGLLMKVSFPLYVVGPTAVVMGPLLRKARGSAGSASASAAGIVALGAAIASPWYLENWRSVLGFVVSGGFGDIARDYGMGPPFSFTTLLTYWKQLVGSGVSVYYGLLLAGFGLAALIPRLCRRREPSWDRVGLLLAWWLVPFLVLSFALNKDIRYTTPYLPALALLLSGAIVGTSGQRAGRLVLALVAMGGLLNYGLYSFGAPGDQPNWRVGSVPIVASDLGWAHPPVREVWPDEEVLRFLTEDVEGIERPRATLLFSHRRLSIHDLNYLAVLRDSPLRFDTCQFQSPESPRELARRIRTTAAYILTKSGDLGGAMLNTKNKEVLAILQREGMPFDRIEVIPLPDGSELTILKRRPS
jgi:4-amino-4-deoxy-L-arabinose transferase-like glycosyltransferase